jgi:hypothetical protein
MIDLSDATYSLLHPERLWSAAEVLKNPSPAPRQPGVYAWYFRRSPPGPSADGCHRHADLLLLYAGISPRQPPRDGSPASRQNLLQRLRYHFRGNAEGSTLRLTLGCLLSDELGIELRRVGSGKRMTFGSGEDELTRWMAENALVAWQVCPEPWTLEEHLIRTVALPLNLDQNRDHPFHGKLSSLRSACKARARTLPSV